MRLRTSGGWPAHSPLWTAGVREGEAWNPVDWGAGGGEGGGAGGWWARGAEGGAEEQTGLLQGGGPQWRGGGPSSLTPACVPQSPALRPRLCLRGWAVWGGGPTWRPGRLRAAPPASWSSGGPGLSLGPVTPSVHTGPPLDPGVWVSGLSSSWKRRVVLAEDVCGRQGRERWERTRANVWLL